MISIDTASNRALFDIGPGDIGAGRRLTMRCEAGIVFTYEPSAPPETASASGASASMGGYRRFFANFAKCLRGSWATTRTA